MEVQATLQAWDTSALLACNGFFAPWSGADAFFLAVTKIWVWLPMYGALLYFLWKSAPDAATFVIRLAALVVGILIWDQGAELAKHYFQRPRPCHTIENLRVLAHCSPYGFFSAHAANTFGLAVLVRGWLPKPWWPLLLLAAAVQSFSRLHLGVHYPSDVLVGMAFGALSATFVQTLVNRKA